MLNMLKDFQALIVGLVIGLCLVVSVRLGTEALSTNSISVTGSAFKVVKSDNATWRVELSSRHKTQSGAYNAVSKQVPVLKEYLLKSGIKGSEIEVLPTTYYQVYAVSSKTGYSTSVVEGYNYSQIVKVTSDDVEKVKELANSVQSLLARGLTLSSNQPEYNYSKLADLKIELLQMATVDAKERAKSMLKANGNSVGSIKSVKMGVFQITPPDSNSVSDWGINDSSTIDKKVSAVANVEFRVK